jgi:hypothetical protein
MNGESLPDLASSAVAWNQFHRPDFADRPPAFLAAGHLSQKHFAKAEAKVANLRPETS